MGLYLSQGCGPERRLADSGLALDDEGGWALGQGYDEALDNGELGLAPDYFLNDRVQFITMNGRYLKGRRRGSSPRRAK